MGSSYRNRPQRLLSAHGGLKLLLCAGCILGLLGCNLELKRAQRALRSEEALERVRGLQLLARSKDPAFAVEVLPLLKDRAASVRQAAVAALGALGPDAHLAPLMDRLLDEDLEVRLAAVRVLGDSRSPRAQKVLLPMRRDPSPVIRNATAAALKALGVSELEQAKREAAAELEEQFKQLRQPDGQLRLEAVTQLGRSGRQEVLPALIAALDDQEVLVVRAAALALGSLGGEQACDALSQLASSPSAALRAAVAAGLAGLASCAGPLSKLVQDSAPEVQRASLTALAVRAASGHAVTPPEELCSLLLQPGIGQAAAELIRQTAQRCPEAQTELLHRAAQGQAEALELVALLGGPSAPEALRQGAQQLAAAYQRQVERWVSAEAWQRSDEDAGEPAAAPASKPPATEPAGGEREAALHQLLDSFPARPALEQGEDPLLPPDIPDRQVRAALRQLADDQAALAWLAELARAGPLQLRRAALSTLAQSSSKTIAAAPSEVAAKLARIVAQALSSESVALRQAASGACCWQGEAALAQATQLLDDSDFAVRAAAAACLGRLGRREAVGPLLARLAQEPLAAIIAALGQLGDRRATAALLALLREELAAVGADERLLVIRSLALLRDRHAAPALEQQLTDPDWRVRQAAAEALGASGRPASRQLLAVCAEDFVAEVRRSCQRAKAALAGSAEVGR